MSARNRADAARDYLARGWCPIPIRHREKNPGFIGWQRFAATAEDMPRCFAGIGNIGIILGERSGGLVDVDLDAPEAVALADIYLPRTGAVFGRGSKPRSHRLYVAVGAVYEVFSDPFVAEGKKVLLELRADGADGVSRRQTVFPPSTHECGEQIRWEGDAMEPRTIDAALLRQCCAWLAVGCLVARYIDAEEGTDWARNPTLALPQWVWAGWPVIARPIYGWLGIYNPDSEARRRHLPDDIDLAGLVAMVPNDFGREDWVKAGAGDLRGVGRLGRGLQALPRFLAPVAASPQ